MEAVLKSCIDDVGGCVSRFSVLTRDPQGVELALLDSSSVPSCFGVPFEASREVIGAAIVRSSARHPAIFITSEGPMIIVTAGTDCGFGLVDRSMLEDATVAQVEQLDTRVKVANLICLTGCAARFESIDQILELVDPELSIGSRLAAAFGELP